MAKSAILKQICQYCGKVAVEKDRFDWMGRTIINLECGHSLAKESVAAVSDRIFSVDGKQELRHFQYECLDFVAKSGIRCLIADEQGLGKTLEALGVIKRHYDEVIPAAIVCPSSVKLQWMDQIKKWLGIKGYETQVITSGKEFAVPGFKLYVVTYDLLKNEEMFDLVKDDLKLVVIDECQKIKNHTSGRAKAVLNFVRSTPYILPMSGTPIENNAGEYFTVLNILDRVRFPHYKRFTEEYCDYYDGMYGRKVAGLKNRTLFHEQTKEMIIRRKLTEVMKDMPSFSREFFKVEFDKQYRKAYANALNDLEDAMLSKKLDAAQRNGVIIAIMSILRHLTGRSKIDQATDYCIEHMESTGRKLVLYTHHEDVAQIIVANLNAYYEEQYKEKNGRTTVTRPMYYHSGLNAEKRFALKEEFVNGKNHILVASTQAAGTGVDGIQLVCYEAVMLERQWNPSKEQQAESRIWRIGQTMPAKCTYMIAVGTIDEKFTEIVENKRGIVAGAVDNEDIPWDEASLMTELANVLISSGRERWVLPV